MTNNNGIFKLHQVDSLFPKNNNHEGMQFIIPIRRYHNDIKTSKRQKSKLSL